MSHTTRLPGIAGPAVVDSPSGARVGTRLLAENADYPALTEVGRHLGSLVASHLAWRCRQGSLGAMDKLSCWRGVAPRTGAIMAARNELFSRPLAGKALVLGGAKGSPGWLQMFEFGWLGDASPILEGR